MSPVLSDKLRLANQHAQTNNTTLLIATLIWQLRFISFWRTLTYWRNQIDRKRAREKTFRTWGRCHNCFRTLLLGGGAFSLLTTCWSQFCWGLAIYRAYLIRKWRHYSHKRVHNKRLLLTGTVHILPWTTATLLWKHHKTLTGDTFKVHTTDTNNDIIHSQHMLATAPTMLLFLFILFLCLFLSLWLFRLFFIP